MSAVGHVEAEMLTGCSKLFGKLFANLLKKMLRLCRSVLVT